MSTLKDMFAKVKIPLYQNESLDHYYQEPYQEMDEDNPDQYEMGTPFGSITITYKI